MVKGPGYTVEDLVFYMGLFAGIIGVYLALEPYEVHRLVRLLGGIVVGAGLGWVMLKVYQMGKDSGPKGDLGEEEDDREFH